MLEEQHAATITKPKQARSKARRQALLDHGVILFNAQGLDDVSIQEITRAVGFSTGSFYNYFPDKAAFFVAVQRYVADAQNARADQVFAAESIAGRSLTDRLRLCVDFAITYFRAHTGLVRSALSYERRVPEGWLPNRQTTATIVARAIIDLPAEQAEKLQTAIQLAFGLLVNTLLHDPGPLRLQDEDLTDRLVQALGPYLDE